MGLFDRIRGEDDEVEIKPPKRERYEYGRDRDGSRDRSSRGESDQDNGNEFVLPGMKAASSSSDSRDRSSDRSTRSSRSRDAGVERIIEQNERIIELLEDIAGNEDASNSVL